MNTTTEASAPPRLIEIWGDTVDSRHLAWSIVIGAAVSLATFLIAARVLASIVSSPQLARAYAMLAGLAGCLLAGALCAVLFRPKREVVEGEPADPRWREEVLASLAAEPGGLGSVATLPHTVTQELRELELFDLFASHERKRPPEAGSSASAVVQRTAVLTDPSA